MLWYIIGAIVLLLAYFIYTNRAKRCIIQSPPTDYPILGSIISIMNIPDNIAVWAYDWSVKFNWTPWEATAFGDLHFFVVQTGPQVEHMLKTNWENFLNNTPHKGFLEIGKEFWGRGIFMVDGEEWQTHRKAASYLFSLNALRNKMYHVFYEHTHKLIDILEKNVGKEVDLQLLFQNFTFDTMCEIAFGITPGALEGLTKPQFLIDFDFGQQHIQDRLQQPPVYWKLARMLGWGNEPEFQKTCNRLTGYCSEIIQQRKQAGDLEGRGDLLSMFIMYGRQKNQPELLTDAYLRDVIINFMVAGRDTTAATLTHVFRALSDNPGERTKLTQSLAPMSLCGNVRTDVETLMSQDYLRCVMFETLRLYPSVPIMSRFAIKDDVFPGNLPVRSGALCVVPILAMNRNPKVWSNPLDFIPQRWEGKELPSEFDFPAFWAGPRICLGRVMAQTEMTVAGGLIAKQFKFTVNQKKFTMAQGPVWFFREGLNVLVERADA